LTRHEQIARLSAEVAELRDRLNASQIEDLGEVVEQYMRTADDTWLAYLRGAARNIAGDSTKSRKASLTGLRALGREHIWRLRTLDGVPRRPALLRGVPHTIPGGELDAALIAAGFAAQHMTIKAGRVLLGPVGHSGPRTSVHVDDPQTKTKLVITPLGLAVLDLLDGEEG
jgi:hypothetical protein